MREGPPERPAGRKPPLIGEVAQRAGEVELPQVAFQKQPLSQLR